MAVMQYVLQWSEPAGNDLAAIDQTIARRIVQKVEQYVATGIPLHFAKPLSGRLSDSFRWRVGDYRVIFDVNPRGLLIVLLVLRVKHRSAAYE